MFVLSFLIMIVYALMNLGNLCIDESGEHSGLLFFLTQIHPCPSIRFLISVDLENIIIVCKNSLQIILYECFLDFNLYIGFSLHGVSMHCRVLRKFFE